MIRLIHFLDNIDRRIIYLFVLASLAVPLIAGTTFDPAPMPTAQAFFDTIEALDPNSGKIALISSDWGPNTKAENQAQMEVAIEHLMRKKIPFAITSTYALASPFIDAVPHKIAKKLNEEAAGSYKWEHAKDWVNVGYRPGHRIMIQGLAKADNIHDFWEVDAAGVSTRDRPAIANAKTIRDIGLLLEFTGLVGAFDSWVQYFTAKGYTPKFLHGCTSITIPEARTYISSGQLAGLHEGVAGAAYHEKLLNQAFPKRVEGGRLKINSNAIKINTGLAFAQVMIIVFIILGNISLVLKRIYNV